jgi:hypothetical protein
MQDNQQKNEEEVVQELDFTKPDFIFLPKGRHIYRQQGYFIVCSSCDLTHAVFIGKDRVMVGEDSGGQPILKKRKEVGMV